jgi:F-type H+-transporting ATPase subunit delta
VTVGSESNQRLSYTQAAEQIARVSGGALPAVGDEILAVAGLLAQQPRLRRALSDPARTPEDRADLIGSILTGKVSADTEALLRTLIAGRWSSGAELLTAIERLGVETLLAGSESAGDLADVEDELFRFGQVVDGDSQLAAALGNSTAPLEGRIELAHTLIGGKARPATVRLVDLALTGFGGRNFAAGLSRLVELAAERRDRQIAYVTVAALLSQADEDRLAARLGEIYGRPVDLKVSADPSILGGMSIRVGPDLYDGTVSRRLTETRTALAGKR